MNSFLGIDTSNYTTSAAVFQSTGRALNVGKLLDVPDGALGLRQSDALFSHVKRLPEQFETLKKNDFFENIMAVGASTQPRRLPESYMPCFLAGASQAKNIASVLGVPFYPFAHQEGHIAAALWSGHRMDLFGKSFLAWHLSGGTTELLLVLPSKNHMKIQILGGTTDISAGQLIDRTGKALGLRFPAGKALDEKASEHDDHKPFPVKIHNYTFSLSGMQNKADRMICDGAGPAETASFVLNTVASVVIRTTLTALNEYKGLPVLFSGGVASNSLLRRKASSEFECIFAEPKYSTDNAMGIAILTAMASGVDGISFYE